MVWQGAEICEEGGGGARGIPQQKERKLLQQSSGAPRSEKRRLHLQTA